MSKKPDSQLMLIRQMLGDVKGVTESRFYKDPDPIASPIEMFRMSEGKKGGELFAELSRREKVQVLGDYTSWKKYADGGITFEMMDQVFWNVTEGKPFRNWLDGTGLGGKAVESFWEKLERMGAEVKDKLVDQNKDKGIER